MKKYIYILGSLIIIGGVYLLVNPSESVNNPLKEDKKSQRQVVSKIDKKEINHNFVKNESKPKMINNNSDNIKPKNLKKENINHLVNKDSLKISKKISNFIQNNNLEAIQNIGDVEIYAKNPPVKNEFAPPSPPTLIKLKFKDKNEIIPLNSDLINSNKKIYVVEKKDDKYKDIKEIDTKKLTSFTPPSIGQN